MMESPIKREPLLKPDTGARNPLQHYHVTRPFLLIPMPEFYKSLAVQVNCAIFIGKSDRMNKLFALAALTGFCLNAPAQTIISSTLMATYTQSQVDSIYQANNLPSFLLPIRFDIEIYQLVYETVNYDSTLTFASGAVVIPVDAPCKMPLVSYQHGTIQKASDAPSFNKGEILIAIALAADGYAVSMPDYLGLGITNIPLHPYIHAHSEATASVDMLRAAKTFITNSGRELNGQLFLTGYSQGGHATMALHRLIETQLSGEFTVTASAPMSGPYDVSGTQSAVITNDSVFSQPAYLPFVLFGLNPVYDFFVSPGDVINPLYELLIPPLMNNSFSTGDVNAVMPAIPNEILEPAVLDSFRTDSTHYIRLALRDNDVYDWTPQAPLKMYYCEADEQVAYQNTLVAYDRFIQNGAQQVFKQSAGLTLGHGDCARIALILGKVWFDSVRTDLIKAVFNITPESAPGMNDGSVIANITGGLPPLQFSWSNGVASQHLAGITGGTYILTTQSADSCFRTDTVFVPTLTAMADLPGSSGLIVFPNPFHDQARLFTPAHFQSFENIRLTLTDITGRINDARYNINGSEITLYRDGLANGVYIVKLESPGGVAIEKVILK